MNKEERILSVRLTILEALIDILNEIDKYEHTTHGVICSGDIRRVTDSLRCVWNDPNSYNLYTLSQVIRKFIDTQKLSP